MLAIEKFMKKKFAIIIGVLILAIIALVFTMILKIDSKSDNTSEKKIKVVTTLFPLYDIAKHIGGEDVEVSLLLDPGIEAHAFEPTPNDMVEINKADVFIYTGKFMETWAEDILKAVDNPDLLVIDASHNINVIEEDGHEESEEGNEHGGIDPHIWLDFDNLKMMVNNINDGLKTKAIGHQEDFELRAADYIDNISALDNRYRTGLANCQQDTVIYSGHYAFAYLTKRYHLNYQSAFGLSPNSEPSAKTIAALIKEVKENDLKYIFHEELINPRIADTLHRETGAETLMLSAAHNLSREDLSAGKNLFMVFEENLNNLKTGLKCQ